MALDEGVRQRIASLIQENRVVLFMKGSRQMPMCGFSGAVVQVLDSLTSDYATFNVLSDPQVREGIKEFSQWPTIPQLYVDGQFVGGCDIVREMHQAGELQQLLGGEAPEVAPPRVTITAAARKALSEAAEPGEAVSGLRIEISPSFEYALSFDGARPGDVEVEVDDLQLRFDRSSAGRADGISLDYTEADGGGFQIDNPNEPPRVRQLSPKDLERMRNEGVEHELFDVRTPEERDVARIEGSTLLDEQADQRIAKMSKETKLVFHCHHGGRSQRAAEHYLRQGFKHVYNLAGGIDAWAREVDSSVARY